VPRAPLPVTSVTHDRVASSATSKGITPSSLLLRAHAPNQFPPPEFVYPHLSPEVLAGCCEPLLATGSSRRYLCKSFPGCLSHGSRRVAGCICLFLPLPRRPSPSPANGSAPRIAPQRDFVRRVFRDRRYSLRSGLLVCSPPRSPLPLRRSSPRRAAVTFTPEQKSAPLPVQASGLLAVRLRQLTAKGLPPF
jgi:hypothetical protein